MKFIYYIYSTTILFLVPMFKDNNFRLLSVLKVQQKHLSLLNDQYKKLGKLPIEKYVFNAR